MDWQRMLIPFDSGMDVSAGAMVLTQQVGITDALNLDFGDRGSVRARRGTSLVVGSGYTRRDLNASNVPDENFSATNLRGTGYANPVVHTLRNRLGERPAVATRGRLFSYDGQRWQDRLGFLSARYRRLADFKSLGSTNPTWAAPVDKAVAATFGPADQAGSVVVTLDDNGDPAAYDAITATWDFGRAARVGTVHMAVFTQSGTNNLIGVIRSGTAGTVTQVTLDTVARDPATGTGGQECPPVVCSDYDETHFLVVFATTTLHQYKLLRVSTAGSVTASATGSYGTGTLKSVWITNTAVATNRAVVCLTDTVTTGAQTRVVASSTLADQALNVDVDAGGAYTNLGHLVAGVAEGGQCWTAMVNDAGTLRVVKRSTSAATSTTMFTRPGSAWIAVPGTQRPQPETGSLYNWGVRHQPVKVAGRVILGLTSTPAIFGNRTADTLAHDACPWFAYDVTDVHQVGGAAGTGTLRDPVLVARSQEDQVFAFWPTAAVAGSDGVSYRFPSTRWRSTFLKNSPWAGPQGEEARPGLNEITVTSLRSAHHREATVFDGAVPRVLTRDAVVPVGFPWLDRPTLKNAVETLASGSLAAGSYGFMAIWACVDSSGQVHRSAPSGIHNVSNVDLNAKITLTASVPHFNERDHLTVFTEFYVTSANPTGNAVHYFVGRVAYDVTAVSASLDVTAIDTGQSPVYTDGGVLPATFVQGGGGICVVGQRAWLSDGTTCSGSRLANYLDEAPSWTAVTALSVEIPGSAGRVLAMANLDDKVLAMCERGIWAFTGSGPDDLGQGGAFTEPVRISDLGVVGPRSVVSTPRGVVFQAAGTAADGLADTGGFWVLDRSLSVTQVSSRVKDLVLNQVYDLAWFPERELVLFAGPGQFDAHPVWDARNNKWSKWTISPAAPNQKFENFGAVSGVLWTAGVEVFQMTRLDGVDQDADAATNAFTSAVVTDWIPIAGDQLAWGRCRSITPLGDATLTPWSLTMNVQLDEVGTSMSHNFGTVPTTAGSNAWPANRLAPEAFLVQQKCSVLRVTLTANSGPMNLSGLELKVKQIGEGRRATDRAALA